MRPARGRAKFSGPGASGWGGLYITEQNQKRHQLLNYIRPSLGWESNRVGALHTAPRVYQIAAALAVGLKVSVHS
jgi:hypothetical protein